MTRYFKLQVGEFNCKSEICLNFLKYIHDTDAKIGDKVEDQSNF